VTTTLVAGVAAQQCTVGTEQVLGALRRGIEDVAQRALGIELNWNTFAANQIEVDPARLSDQQIASHFGSDGIDLDFVARRWGSGEPASAVFSAESSVMRSSWESNPDPERFNPAMDVATVGASYPAKVPWASQPVSGLLVIVAISRWAIRGSGEQLDWLADALRSWAATSAEAINADCGFVALAADQSLKSEDSPWESEQRLIPGYRDFQRYLWGCGWGTLLGPSHLATLGGLDTLRAIATRTIELPGGRAWIEISPDPADVPEERLAALQALLGPVLRRADSPRPG
jgi:hypothetical protein